MGKCIVKTIQSISVSFFPFTVCVCMYYLFSTIEYIDGFHVSCKICMLYMEPTVNKNHSKFDQKLCFPEKNSLFSIKNPIVGSLNQISTFCSLSQ